MGDTHSSCNSTPNNSISMNETKNGKIQNWKQSKKWKLLPRKSESKRQREKEHFDVDIDVDIDIDIDLDIVDPEIPSSVISWNCHHKLAEIEQNLRKFKSKFINNKTSKIKSKSLNDLMPNTLSKYRFVYMKICFLLDKYKININIDKITRNDEKNENLWLELDFITNDISSTIHGITHNFLDGIENERGLLDYWLNESINNNKNGISLIVFKIDEMNKIHNNLGWKSGDNIIIQTGKKIKEYIDWFERDYNFKFKLFHPDFALNEFIVISNCIHDDTIIDFAQCILIDVARSIKCFFQETKVWTGYVINNYNDKDNKDNDDDDDEIDDIKYNFRSFYEKAKMAINDKMKICKYSDSKSDRISKWLSPKERLNKGKKIADIIYSFYISTQKKQSIQKNQEKLNQTMKYIEYEIECGADLNYCDYMGNTPFFYALIIENGELIEYLLQFEFNVDHRNKHGQNALMIAMRHKIKESICCVLAKRLKFPNIPDYNNVTSFVWALNKNYFKIMDILSKKGAMDYKNWIISSCIKDQENICDIIKQNGIKIDTKLDGIGRSVLHYAVLHQSLKIIGTILKNKNKIGINVDIVDNNGWSCLHYAAAKGYTQIISLLIRFNANIFLKTEENFTPIYIASKFNRIDAMLLLKKYEKDVKFKNGNYNLSISNDSNSKSSEIEPIKLSFSSTSNIPKLYDSGSGTDNDDIYDDDDNNDLDYNGFWDKENQDLNIGDRVGIRKGSDSNSRSNSRSNPSSSSKFSENNIPPKRVNWKPQSICKIDENCGDYPIIGDDDIEYDAEYDSCSKSQSDQTFIVHNSFSDQIEDALIRF